MGRKNPRVNGNGNKSTKIWKRGEPKTNPKIEVMEGLGGGETGERWGAVIHRNSKRG